MQTNEAGLLLLLQSLLDLSWRTSLAKAYIFHRQQSYDRCLSLTHCYKAQNEQ